VTDRRLPSATILFIAASALVGIAYACLVWQQLRYGLEYDESYNLTVVKNLAEGHGYATTGVAYGWLKAFDPGASTGPALLMPGALLWTLSGGTLWIVRLVPILYFLLYVGSLGWLFTSIAGRWAGLIAAASPLVLSVAKPDISTVSLVPGRYVGEIAAVSFTVLMAVFIYRNKPLLAGVAGGLAVQTKFNFALPILAVVIVWIVGAWLRKEPSRAVALLRMVVGLAIPTLIFEVFRLAQIGPVGYVASIKDYIVWLGGQAGSESAPMLETIGRRIGGLADTLSVGGALLLVAAVTILMLGVLAPLLSSASAVPVNRAPGDPRAFDPVIALLTSAGVMLLWWALIPPEKLPRAGMPIILLAAPVLLVSAFYVLSAVVRGSEGRARVVLVGLSAAVAGASFLVVGAQAWTAIGNDFGHRLYTEQVAGAAAIADSGTPSIPNVWIWHLASLQTLSGVPSETKPGVARPTIQVFDSIRARTDNGVDDARSFLNECATVLYSSRSVVVCR
jgi:hypothetical protein